MKLQLKDLMIGDWVQLNGKPMQVSRIDLYSVNAKPAFCCGSPHIWSYNNDFKPIPLTQEILEKNGWSEDYDEETGSVSHHFPEDTDFKLEIYSEGKTVLWTINCYEYEIIRFSYVHELQHALKLCKIEKTIII